jgi:hypothetical protein
MGPLVNPSWLAATADRERTVGVLRAGFVEGRLDQDELDQRIAQAYAARTYADLWTLTADLPTGPLPYPHQASFPHGYRLPGYSPHADAAALPDAEVGGNWRSGAALLALALVIFTMAALVTAIITAHGQAVVVTPYTQSGTANPYQVRLLPDFTANNHGPEPGEVRVPAGG